MKKLITYSLIALSLTLSSCEKFLDVKPQTQVPTEDIFMKEHGFEDVLNGCYIKMSNPDLYGKFLTFNGVDFLAQYYSEAQSTTLEGGLTAFDYKHKYVEPQIKATYNALYNVILQANDVIEHIEKPETKNIVKSATKRNHIKGEALAIRAFIHFDILRLFGQMPVNGSTEVSLAYSEFTGVENRPLYSFEDFLQKIQHDLENAEKLLSDDPVIKHNLKQHIYEDIEDDFYQYRRFRFNYYAVKALKARVYLYVGDKEKAYATAHELLDAKDESGNYFRLAGDNDLNKGNYALPSETILGLSYSNLEEYENEIKTHGTYLFSEKKKEDMFQGRNTAANNRFNKLWGQTVAPSGSMMPYYKKFMQNEGKASTAEKFDNRWFYPLLRYSEIYLIILETSNDLNEVNTLFKDYMLARNEQIGAFKKLDDARKEVINEYRREFMGEGQMFFTYKRLGAKSMKWRYDDITEENYIVPVPSSEIIK